MLFRAALVLQLGCAAAALAGCGDETASGPKAFRVALLTPGSVSDGGWNQAAYDGLKRIQSELGAEVSARIPYILADVLNQHMRDFSAEEAEQMLSLLMRFVRNGAAAVSAAHDQGQP